MTTVAFLGMYPGEMQTSPPPTHTPSEHKCSQQLNIYQCKTENIHLFFSGLMRSIYIMEYYLAIKTTELSILQQFE